MGDKLIFKQGFVVRTYHSRRTVQDGHCPQTHCRTHDSRTPWTLCRASHRITPHRMGHYGYLEPGQKVKLLVESNHTKSMKETHYQATTRAKLVPRMQLECILQSLVTTNGYMLSFLKAEVQAVDFAAVRAALNLKI